MFAASNTKTDILTIDPNVPYNLSVFIDNTSHNGINFLSTSKNTKMERGINGSKTLENGEEMYLFLIKVNCHSIRVLVDGEAKFSIMYQTYPGLMATVNVIAHTEYDNLYINNPESYVATSANTLIHFDNGYNKIEYQNSAEECQFNITKENEMII